MRQKMAIGNWKMNGLRANLTQLDALRMAHDGADVELLICPSFPLIATASNDCADHPMQIGAQDCHAAESGAHTGDTSAIMLKDAGASAVILGHSERRADHGETSDLVRA